LKDVTRRATLLRSRSWMYLEHMPIGSRCVEVVSVLNAVATKTLLEKIERIRKL
jgi:hypothetical protein